MFGRHFAHGHDVVTPVVDAELAAGNRTEHRGNLSVGHRRMRTQGGHDIGEGIVEIIVDHLRYRTRV